jgi:DnaJ family protein A protein 2
MSRDLYAALEIDRSADATAIRSAYLKLSRKYHPDKAPEEKREEYQEKFKLISRAYEVLKDEDKKAFYDQTGRVPGEQGAPDDVSHAMGGGIPFPFDMNSMFGMFGGGGGPGGRLRGRRPGKAPTRKTQIPLNLKDFYYGRTLQVNLERQRFCADCKGEGTIHMSSCDDCRGTGMVTQVIQMGPMIMHNAGPCMKCKGSGKTSGEPCGTCKGSKFGKQEKQLELKIKPGAKHGDTILFPGESSHTEEYTEPGDVLIELVAADEDHGWERHGDSLKHRVGLTLGEALCGKVVKLDGHPAHPDGVFIRIPQGMQNRQEIVVEGLGMPRNIGGGFGDGVLILTVLATKEERALLESKKDTLKEIFNADAGPEDAGLVWSAKPIVY